MPEQTTRPRGRPRPQETIDRDRRILEHLKESGPLTRNQIADALGEERSKTWLSLNRLRKEDLVRTCTAKGGGADMLWTTEVRKPCP